MTKNLICCGFGVIGSIITTCIGGWSSSLTTLSIFMILDYITGLIVALVFVNSTKTESGGLSSKVCLKGLLKKIGMLILIAVAYRVDLVLGIDYLRDAVVIAFIVNELISLLENAALMGIPIPTVLTKAIDVLKEKEDSHANH